MKNKRPEVKQHPFQEYLLAYTAESTKYSIRTCFMSEEAAATVVEQFRTTGTITVRGELIEPVNLYVAKVTDRWAIDLSVPVESKLSQAE